MSGGPGDVQVKLTETSLPGKSVCPPLPPEPEVEPPESPPPDVVPPAVVPDVVPPAVVPDVVPPADVPEVVPPAVVVPLVVPPAVVDPPPSVTLMVAPGCTVSFGVHLVSVEIGLETLILYASGVSVISPAFSSFSVPFMSGSTMALFLGIGGFCRGPSICTVPVAAPPSLSVPVGLTVSLSRSRMSGFLEAASTVFHTTSTVSPTLASAGAVNCTLVVPCTAEPRDGRRNALRRVRDVGGLCRTRGQQHARAAEHHRDSRRDRPAMRTHECPFVVGLFSDGAESGVNHGSAAVVEAGPSVGAAVEPWAGPRVRRGFGVFGAFAVVPARRGERRRRARPGACEERGRTLSTTAMPIRNTAAGTTRHSRIQKSVTPRDGRPPGLFGQHLAAVPERDLVVAVGARRQFDRELDLRLAAGGDGAAPLLLLPLRGEDAVRGADLEDRVLDGG